MMLGFALAAVGMDTVTGQLRLTFGSTELMRGFDFLIAVIGLFGIGEILLSMEEGLALQGQVARASTRRSCWQTWKKLPQVLGDLAAQLADRLLDGHHAGRRHAGLVHELRRGQEVCRRTATKFGTGEIEGVIAPETAAHAAGTSALLPMLALGIPGSPTAAVLLGGLLIWGLQPGPLLFVEQKDFVWGLIASMYLGNIVGLIVVLTTVPLFASILRIPFSIIAPVIIVICAIGAYTVHGAMLDVWFMLGFGVIGYVFKKLDYPLAPLVLALVLGDKAEDSFRQAMLVSQGDLGIMWSNPLVGSITTLALVMLFWPLISKAAGDAAGTQGRRVRRAAAGGLKGVDMPVIALTQGMGSLAQDIAEQLAAQLNLTTLQHEVVERVAEQDACLEEPDQPAARRQGRRHRAAARRPPGDRAVHRRRSAGSGRPGQRRAARLGRDLPAAAGAARARACASCGRSPSAWSG